MGVLQVFWSPGSSCCLPRVPKHPNHISKVFVKYFGSSGCYGCETEILKAVEEAG